MTTDRVNTRIILGHSSIRKVLFCIVLKKQHIIFIIEIDPLMFQLLLYIPPTMELSIVVHSVRTILLPFHYVSYRKETNTLLARARGGTMVEALRYKPEGRGIDSRWCHWNCLLT
jgi:hypothetical protein